MAKKEVKVIALRDHQDGNTLHMKGSVLTIPAFRLREKQVRGLVKEYAAAKATPQGGGSAPSGGRSKVDDLSSLSKAELEELAASEGIEPEGSGKDGAVLKADLVEALSG